MPPLERRQPIRPCPRPAPDRGGDAPDLPELRRRVRGRRRHDPRRRPARAVHRLPHPLVRRAAAPRPALSEDQILRRLETWSPRPRGPVAVPTPARRAVAVTAPRTAAERGRTRRAARAPRRSRRPRSRPPARRRRRTEARRPAGGRRGPAAGRRARRARSAAAPGAAPRARAAPPPPRRRRGAAASARAAAGAAARGAGARGLPSTGIRSPPGCRPPRPALAAYGDDRRRPAHRGRGRARAAAQGARGA